MSAATPAAATAPDAALDPTRRRRPLLRRLLGAVLVVRLELRPPAPLDAGLILLAWLRRPAIEMPLRAAHAAETTAQRLCRRLDEVYPF